MDDSINPKTLEESLQEELCVVYVLYFDESKGHVPLLIFPVDEKLVKENKRFMRPIKYHPIWFLSVEEQGPLDHIDLEFKGYAFFGKKFLTKSKRKKRRAGLKEETPETIVVIVSLANDLAAFGADLIHLITSGIKEKFDNKLFRIIEYLIVKDQVVKTPLVKKRIEEGIQIKKDLNNLIQTITDNYFSSSIKQSNMYSIKKQKAFSYLALKGFDVSHSSGTQNMKLFEQSKEAATELTLKAQFIISSVSLIDDNQELEIIVQNNTGKEIKDVIININHVKEFFEKEIMEQEIDLWFPDEELLFISPISQEIKECLFFITEKANKEKLLSKKIDLTSLIKYKN